MAESGDRSQFSETSGRANGGGEPDRGAAEARRASEALGRLRVVIEQATEAIRELAAASEEWAGLNARELRQHGERAAGALSRQVEEYPLASLALAFAAGYLCGTLLTRR